MFETNMLTADVTEAAEGLSLATSQMTGILPHSLPVQHYLVTSVQALFALLYACENKNN